MKKEGVISMSAKELKKLQVIQQVTEKRLKQTKAAEFLELSLRHVKRLVQRFREEGPASLVHRLRGRSSNRRCPDRIRAKVLQLYQTRYRGFGPTLASEKLLERNQNQPRDLEGMAFGGPALGEKEKGMEAPQLAGEKSLFGRNGPNGRLSPRLARGQGALAGPHGLH